MGQRHRITGGTVRCVSCVFFLMQPLTAFCTLQVVERIEWQFTFLGSPTVLLNYVAQLLCAVDVIAILDPFFNNQHSPLVGGLMRDGRLPKVLDNTSSSPSPRACRMSLCMRQ